MRGIEMNATMVASGTKTVPPVVSSIQDIPLGKIRESKTNPRRFFDEAKLAELADFVPGNKIRVMWRFFLCCPRKLPPARIPYLDGRPQHNLVTKEMGRAFG